MIKAAILGCGYVGTAVARCWSDQGIHVTATTTSPDRVTDLRSVAGSVKIVHGADLPAVEELVQSRELLLIAVAGGRKAGYEAVYLDTAKTVLAALDKAPHLRQIIYTSSFSVYGHQTGAVGHRSRPDLPGHRQYQSSGRHRTNYPLRRHPRAKSVRLTAGGASTVLIGNCKKIYSRAAGSVRPGTGTEGSNWIHLDDIVGAIDFARQHALSGIYNVVQDEVLTSKRTH